MEDTCGGKVENERANGHSCLPGIPALCVFSAYVVVE